MTNTVNVRKGSLWTLIWWGIKLSLKFISNVILTRLLSPEMFGIAAIGNSIVAGVGLLSDFGVKQNVVRTKRTDDSFFQTAWTVQVLRGLIIALIIVLMARPFSALYDSEGLTTFLLIVAASNVAMGFNNIEALRAFRDANLRGNAAIDIGGAVVGLAAMLVWAWFSPSYIALAVGAVVSTAVSTIGTLVIYPRYNCRLKLEKGALKELVGFGQWVLISTMLAFATTQMDRLALGKLIPMQLVGLYAIAWMWASAPNQLLDQWAQKVFFPVVAQEWRNQAAPERTWQIRRMVALIAGISALVMYSVADALVKTIYKIEYHEVAHLIRLLSPVVFLYSVEQSYSHILIAQGRPREKIVGQAIGIALFGFGLIPAFTWMGLSGVVSLLGVSAIVQIVWLAYKLTGIYSKEVRFDALILGLFFLLAPLLYALNTAYSSFQYQVAMALLCGTSAVLAVFFVYRRVKRICDSPA